MKAKSGNGNWNPFDVRALWGNTAYPFGDAGKTYQAWLDGVTEMQAEATQFFNGRMDKDAAALSALSRCATPTEALELQAKYVEEWMGDCVAEGQRMITLGTDTAEREAAAMGMQRRGRARPAKG